MPYLDVGRGLKIRKKRRFHYRRLMLFLANTHEHILKSIPGLQGNYEIKTLKHRRDLESHFQWTSPLDNFQVSIAIHKSLDRLQGLLISGGYDYYIAPKRRGSFEYSLTWSGSYPYYQASLQIRAQLDMIDQEEYDLQMQNMKIIIVLNRNHVSGSQRSSYFNWVIDLKRIAQDYDKSEWITQIENLKEEGREGELETTTYSNLDMGVLEELVNMILPELGS